MAIKDQHKCIFIHVIKTAGASIVAALGMKRRHISASRIRRAQGEDEWNSHFKFSFVRNPYDKIVSQYHFNRHLFGLKDASFKEYLIHWKNGKKISKYPQYHHCYIDEDLDFIGRFETLQKDFNTVCDNIGIPQKKLPHRNKSKHKHYTVYYDDESRQIVAEKFAKDIEIFGYEFE